MALNILHPILSKTQWQLKLCCESIPKISVVFACAFVIILHCAGAEFTESEGPINTVSCSIIASC